MNRSSKFLLALLVLLPLGLFAWGGVRLAAHERERVQANIQQLLTNQLAEIDRSIAGQFDAFAADLQQLTAIDEYDADQLRDIARNDARVFQMFVINPDDALIYPSPLGPVTAVERDFLLKASDLINDRQIQRSQRTSRAPNRDANDKGSYQKLSKKQKGVSQTETQNSGDWFVWYWGPGINLIYWQRRPNNHIVGVAVDRSRWIADVIAKLPDTPVPVIDSKSTLSRHQIVESGREVIYKWGAYSPALEELPAAEYRLAAPLSAWQLQTYVPLNLMTAGQSGTFNLMAGLVLSGFALIGLAYAIDRQYGHELREAARRVSFVNQVSHELRTPLTNIRMYAELLEHDFDSLEPDTSHSRSRLNVILSESQRLTRLIGNVLTFARQEKQTLQVCRNQVVADDIIQNVVDSFRPSLEQKQIAVELDLQSSHPVSLDADILEQILGNLISNVEKYAADGNWMKIRSSQSETEVTISVTDRGPGIAPSHCDQIFEPFWRASNDLSQSAGTGIGLTIVRSLARLHGGDVHMNSSKSQTEFTVTLGTVVTAGERNEDSDR
ncbi:sensor histidine kinase [Thalassoglobus polymorphus]|uniref:sensor histidine kinase n=1 Tax=Thalassoglobus polymorphus TaxID=2527994 RepID=UPI0011AA2835|nr:HAMP domain-containing sensor histidine kinase [Thalassoglobus polymorphus]